MRFRYFLTVNIISLLAGIALAVSLGGDGVVLGQGNSTVGLLSPWRTTGGYVKTASSTASVWVPGLASADECILTDGDGKFYTATCGTGGGGGGDGLWTYSAGSNWLFPTIASTSPTAIVRGSTFLATSTSATSSLPLLSVSTGISLLGTFADQLSDLCVAITGGSELCDGTDNTGGAWGSITGTLSAQTDLQTALDAKLSLSAFYSTTTSDIGEGTNLYYTNERVATYINSSTTIPADLGTVTNSILRWSGTRWLAGATSTLGISWADVKNKSVVVGELASVDFGDWTCNGSTCVNDTDSIALTTDTTGNYVGTVADGTGIDGTASAEGATYTPTFDATELTALTWSAGGSSSFRHTFNVSTGLDPVLEFGSNSVSVFNTLTAPSLTASSSTSTLNGIIISGLNCSGLTNGGALTVNASGELVCSDDAGGAGGSSEHIDAGSYVYPAEGDYHSAPYYVGTSTTASSTFTGLAATSFGIPGRFFADATNFIINGLQTLFSQTVTFNSNAIFNGSTRIYSSLQVIGAMFAIGTSTNPAIASDNNLAINTTAASSSLRFHDGTAERVLNTDRDKTLFISTSTILSIAGSVTGSTTLILNRPSRPETYTKFFCTTNTGTWGFVLGDGTASSSYSSCSTSGVGVDSPSNSSFTMREIEYLQIGPPSANNTIATLVFTVRTDSD